jgi:hypothetical protein
MLVDGGGFFPEQADYEDVAWFLMDGMKLLGTDAVGVGDKELRYGRSFLLANMRRTKLPLVNANLIDKSTKKPLVAPWVIKKVGSAKVGVFGLMSDKVDTGPSRDSLFVEEPTAAATKAVAALRKQGATVIVLLSQLGKVETEDLVTAVQGIDAVVVGRNVPLLQKGRLIQGTVACYGGEQGQYLGRTILNLTAAGRSAGGDNETYMLGPEVGEKQEVLTLVKSFEDSFNDKLRQKEKERIAKDQVSQTSQSGLEVDHYLGAEVCGRCHVSEMAQWKTTAHAKAWETLVDNKVDSRPDCIPCHVVGYQQAGGFKTADDVARVADVQCESCHGMGTQHEAYPTAARRITEETCLTCHNSTTSPTFDFKVYQPHVVHTPVANLPPLPVNPNKKAKMLEMGKGGK